MIDQLEGFRSVAGDVFNIGQGRWRGRPCDHGDRKAERAGGIELGAGSAAAAVLGYDEINGMVAQKGGFIFQTEGSACFDKGGMGQIERRCDGVDGPDEIVVLRRAGKRGQFLPAQRDEDAPRPVSGKVEGFGKICDLTPVVTGARRPGRAAHGDQRYAGLPGSRGGIGRHARGEGMGGVDQEGDVMFTQPAGEAVRAAKAAAAGCNRLGKGFLGASGQREDGGKVVAPGDKTGELACLAAAAQNENGSSHGPF